MSLYHRFGSKVVVLADCGEHQPPYLRAPGRLLLTVHLPPENSPSDAFLHFDFAHTLRAELGLTEIDLVIESVPDISLNSELLQAAFEDAE